MPSGKFSMFTNRRAAFLALCLCCVRVVYGQEFIKLPVSVGLAGSPVNACDFCLASQGISPLEVGASGVRIDLRYLHLGTPYREGTRISNDDNELETHLTQQYSIFYSLSSRFTLSGYIPVPYRHGERRGEDGSMIAGNQFGVGDVSLLLRYKPLMYHSMEFTAMLSVAVGLKLPSGRTDGSDSQGALLDPHLQLGTGSTDLLLGTSGIIAWDNTALIANLLYGLAGPGAHGHRFGNNLNYDLALRIKVLPADYAETQLFATIGIDGEWRGEEVQNGERDENSGGNVSYISPGLQIFLGPSISIEATYQYAVLHSLNGRQLGEDYRIVTGVQILFW